MRSATTTSRLPLGGGGSSLFRAFIFDGAQPPPEGTTYGAYWVEVGPRYFETLAARPIAGRLFTEEDDGAAPLVAIVDEAMARRMGEGREMVGRAIRSTYDENLPREVVGVVANIQLDSRTDESPDPVVFVPRAQAPRASMRFVIRTDGDAAGVLPAVRGEMTALDPDVAIESVRTLEQAHRDDLAGVRFLTALFAAFGAVALVLAAGGVYGLASFSVSQRRKEIGIRLAVGATSGAVRRMVLSEGARLALIGCGIGLGLAWVLARLVSSALFGVTELEPMGFAAVAALLCAPVVAATWSPAARAGGVEPGEVLRGE